MPKKNIQNLIITIECTYRKVYVLFHNAPMLTQSSRRLPFEFVCLAYGQKRIENGRDKLGGRQQTIWNITIILFKQNKTKYRNYTKIVEGCHLDFCVWLGKKLRNENRKTDR
jgi:hypothetical protein